MSKTFTTPIMNLVLPISGPGGETGPDWANDLNNALQALDSHDHTTGNGKPVPASGLNINSDLSFQSNNGTNIRSSRYSSQASALAQSLDKNCVSVVNGNLFFNNNSGVAIQITSGSGLNAASIGGIGGDYASSGASESYSSTTKTFTFTQSSGVSAAIASGPLSLSVTTAGANTVTLTPPAGLSSSYSVTFPTALPTLGTKFLTVDTAGQLYASCDVDNSSLEIASGVIQVKNSGIVQSMIATGNVGSSQLAAGAVDNAALGGAAVATGNIQDGAVTQAKRAAAISTTSAISSASTSSSTVYVGVCSVSLTTTGRPVLLTVQPGINSTACGVAGYGRIRIIREGVVAYEGELSNTVLTSFTVIDVPAAGSHSWGFQIFAYSSSTVTATSISLFACEL